MPRFTARMGVLALSALLLSGTALADTPDQTPPGTTMMQGLDAGVRDAQLKRSAHDYTGAIRVLSQLMLVAPDDARVVGEYGKVLIQQGRAAEAIDFLTRAVELQPGDWTLYSALGIAYDQKSDFANARTAYERALMIKPGETVVLNNYAMSRMLAGDLAQARRLIAEAASASKDERIASNVKLINGLTPPVVATSAPKPAPVAAAIKAAAPTSVAQHAPRLLGPSTVVMQAVPVDPKAGSVVKPKPAGIARTTHKPASVAVATHKPASVAATTPKPAANGGIPALRLANDRP